MRGVKTLGIGILCGAMAAGARAAEPLHNWYVFPAVASAPGQLGTYFRTDLFLQNPFTWKAITVRVELWKSGLDNSSPLAKTLTIPAGGQLFLQDVLKSQFGYTGGGALLVESQSLSGALFVATSRTSTGAGTGTYGLAEPGQATVAAAGARTFLPGVRNSAAFRTNTGAANAGKAPIELLVEVFDAGGRRTGARSVTVPPRSSVQLAVKDFSETFESGYAIWTCSSTGPDVQWMAYATPIDNATGDSSFIAATLDDAFTAHQSSYDMTGLWQGTETGSFNGAFGTNIRTVVVLQNGPWVRATFYDATFGYSYAQFTGYEERGKLELSGTGTFINCLASTARTSATTTGTTWFGSTTGTGCFGNATYSFTKLPSSLSPAELTGLDRIPPPRREAPGGARLWSQGSTP